MNLIESLLAAAEPTHIPEDQRTTYWLQGQIIYADEIYSPTGFMPLLGRMAERKVARILPADGMSCGFVYQPGRDTIFGEMCFTAEPAKGIYEDSIRLAALVDVSQKVLGMGYKGAIDITPVYQFFMGLERGARDALLQADDKELKSWPLYQVFPVTA